MSSQDNLIFDMGKEGGGEEGEHPKDTNTMASSAALKTAKKKLRSLMKQKLSTISSESINTQSKLCLTMLSSIIKYSPGTAVFKRITVFKSYQNAKRIGIYLSMPSGEIQTDAIVRHALGLGKQVFVPYLHKPHNPPTGTPRSVMEMVDLRSITEYDALKRDSWGIPTIDTESVEEREHILRYPTGESGQLDMILMPGVAFDMDQQTGSVRRLGHGKGFYDYFLHRYNQDRRSRMKELSENGGTDVLLYGLGLEEQFLQAKFDPSVPVGEHDHMLHGLLVGDGRLVDVEGVE